MIEPIRLLLVDDHPVVRKGLRAYLESEPDLRVAGEAGDGLEAAAQARALQPDVILMDLFMPNCDGIQATRAIMDETPEARVLVLTSFAEDGQIFPAMKAGARGYVLKDSSPEDLVRAIREVRRGESFLSPLVAQKLMQEYSLKADDLTEREVDVLRQVACGLSNQQIATALFISERTVRTHVSHILAKLRLANRTQATLYAQRQGLTA